VLVGVGYVNELRWTGRAEEASGSMFVGESTICESCVGPSPFTAACSLTCVVREITPVVDVSPFSLAANRPSSRPFRSPASSAISTGFTSPPSSDTGSDGSKAALSPFALPFGCVLLSTELLACPFGSMPASAEPFGRSGLFNTESPFGTLLGGSFGGRGGFSIEDRNRSWKGKPAFAIEPFGISPANKEGITRC
jgi:hypothetical protein